MCDEKLLAMLYSLLPEAAKAKLAELEAAEASARKAEAEAQAATVEMKKRLLVLERLEPLAAARQEELDKRDRYLFDREQRVKAMHKEAEEDRGRAKRDFARAKRASEVAQLVFDGVQGKLREEVGQE